MTTPDTGNQNLSQLRIPELRKIAIEMGLRGLSGMRKSDLVALIESRGAVRPDRATLESRRVRDEASSAKQEAHSEAGGITSGREGEENSQHSGAATDAPEGNANQYETPSQARRARRLRAKQQHDERGGIDREGGTQRESESEAQESQDARAPEHGGAEDRAHDDRGSRSRNDGGNRNGRGDRADRNDRNDDDNQNGGRRNRRNRRNRRGRDNNRGDNRSSSYDGNDSGNEDQGARSHQVEYRDVAGILDVVDRNVAFLRTSGYRPASSDVFVATQLIKRFGLRSGDCLVGQVKVGGGQTRGHGRNRQKYNNLSRVDSVNGLAPEEARQRPEFSKLTPLYPNQRLRLETEQRILTTRVIDLIMPIGKGQRALIVSPPKAGKTTILQNIANAIATNNPECYLMVVLVDERPEEVTDMQRSVNGEVIASTFDRPPSEHTAVAELAIERAKRLVEQGKDVVVLLDSITRLGRAYNNSSPASGRILSGGVDSNALYPPKRFLGAARNIEHGGSLTIIATAMVETGSAGDTVIFEEFKGTGNAELKLDRKISERRVFPAVDVNPSGTRKDELLLAPDEARVMHKLRRILAALDNQQAIDLLIKQLKKTRSNGEFLMQVASSAPMVAASKEEDYS